MNTRFLYLMLAICFFSFLSHSGNIKLDQYLDALKNYSTEKAPEKVYIQTDKPYYTTGETIWIKATLVNGVSHLQSEKSKVVYLELFDPKDQVVIKQKLFINQFSAAADIEVPINWESGNYVLRAYTNYMQNKEADYFFQKEIPILVQTPQSELSQDLIDVRDEANAKEVRPNIRFFPEGGDLISGLANKIGIKATDANGNSISLEGHIEDESGEEVMKFSCKEMGLGILNFTPLKNIKYKAVVQINGINQVFDFPESKESGYVLNINNRKDRIFINVATNTNEGLQGFFILAHLRGKAFFDYIVEDDLKEFSIKLITEQSRNGVAQITLFKPTGEPVCERLVFIHNPKADIQLDMSFNQESYQVREKVQIELMAKDSSKQGISADLSLLVLDKANLSNPDGMESLSSYFLLNSDLKGEIKNPGYFFNGPMDAKKRFLLDALMLTQGWRRFVWKDLKTLDPRIKHKPEQGLFIKGKTTALDNPEKPKETKAFLNFFANGRVFTDEKKTNSKGDFSFGPYILYDTIETIIQARVPPKKQSSDPLKGNRYVSIFVDPDKKNLELNRALVPKFQAKEASGIINYLKSSREIKRMNAIFDGMTYEMDELVVTSKKKRKQETVKEVMDKMTGIYSNPSARLEVDSLPGIEGQSVFDLLRRVPGVTVRGAYPTQSAQIRGPSSINASNEPLYLINGSPVSVDVISALFATEVFFIDVLKGPDASIFGLRGANGVIAVYTHIGNIYQEAKREPGIINFSKVGFYKAREFYASDYSSKKEEHEKPDYRTTVHWAPGIILSGENPIEESFFTADSPGTYLAIVEGITVDGRCIYQTKEIRVE